MKKSFSLLAALILVTTLLTSSISAIAITPDKATVTGARSNTTKNLSDGVTYTQLTAAAGTTYGGSDGIEFNIVEADMSTANLRIDDIYSGSYATHSYKTVTQITTSFNSANSTLNPIAAVNADLWWMYTSTYTEAANGGAKVFRDGKSFTTSLGFTMSQGEIYTSDRMSQENFVARDGALQLPYVNMLSFGITSDSVPILSNPNAVVNITNTTKNTTASADGINRIPAYNTLVMYTDKGPQETYANTDAFEVQIKFSSDYKITHGTNITGTVESIHPSGGSTNPVRKENCIILTARGNKTDTISGYQVGDKVNIKVSITDQAGTYTEQWQKATDAVSGHLQFVKNGRGSRQIGLEANYPATFIGITNDNHVIMGTLGATKDSSRKGILNTQYDELASDLNLRDAFLVDGGGSSTLVLQKGSGYSMVNHPSDETGERQILNALILSVDTSIKLTPTPTVKPTQTVSPTNTATATATAKPTSGNKTSSPSKTATVTTTSAPQTTAPQITDETITTEEPINTATPIDVDADTDNTDDDDDDGDSNKKKKSDPTNTIIIICCIAITVVVAAVIVLAFVLNKKKK